MIVLGCDPSLTGFGWCVHDSQALGLDRVLAKGRWSTTSSEIWVERYVALRGHLITLFHSMPQIEKVGVESPPFGEQSSELLYALFLMVNEAVWMNRRDVVYFDPVTVKMLTKVDPSLRKGKMHKSDMIEAAKADTGIKKWNADEADAYHVARFSARFWELHAGVISLDDLSPAEHRAFAREHTFTRGERAGETVRYGALFKEGKRFYLFSKLDPYK